MAHASLEKRLAAAQTTKLELESKLREKDLLIERLEGDRRWLAEREKEEREEKERERERERERRAPTPAEEYALSVIDMRAVKERTPVLVNVEPDYGALGQAQVQMGTMPTPVVVQNVNNTGMGMGNVYGLSALNAGSGMPATNAGYGVGGVDALANPPPRGEYWLIRPTHTGTSNTSDESKKSKHPFLR